jgi:hypothetical protein
MVLKNIAKDKRLNRYVKQRAVGICDSLAKSMAGNAKGRGRDCAH